MADRIVIMNEGQIQQVGTPMDVYRAPQTRFVADFVGTNNIIDGVVSACAGGDCRIATDLGVVASSNPSNATIATGDKIHLVVSAGVVAVNDPAASASANAVTTRLVGESFVGNVVTLVLEAGGGQELKVQLQQRALQDLKLRANDEVTLTFDRQDALIIPAS